MGAFIDHKGLRLDEAIVHALRDRCIRESHLDADESAFFALELEHLKAQLFMVEFAPLRAREFIPVSNEAASGVETIAYLQFTQHGMADLIKDYASDAPRFDVTGEKFYNEVESVGGAFGYNLQEIRASEQAGRSLPTLKAEAAREGHERKVDEVAAIGDTASGMPGFINNSNVPVDTVTGGTWDLKPPDDILRDMHDSVQNIIDVTKEAETPDTIILPPEKFAIINQRRVVDTDKSILRYFLENNAWVRNVGMWHRLKGAGAASADRMVTYRRDPSKVQLEIPQEFEMLPVQIRNYEFLVNTHSRIGGVVFYKPLSARYTDGI